MAAIEAGKKLSQFDYTTTPAGADMYAEQGGESVRIRTGEPNGLATLDDDGKTPAGQIPDSIGPYTPPSTGVATTVRAFLDSLWETGVNAGAKVLRWFQGGAGAVPQTVEQKLRRIVHVEDFGAVGDGEADDTAAFNAAIVYVASIGGGEILLDSANYKISSKILIQDNNILVRGRGRSDSHDTGTNVPGTQIHWYGAANGTMFEFSPIEGSGRQRGHGGGLVNLALYGRGVANTGLMVKSWRHGEFDVYGASLLRTVVETGVVTTLSESRDTQLNEFWIASRQIGESYGSTLIADGATGANTSFNIFHEINATYNKADCLVIRDTDSNEFGVVRLNTVAGFTGRGVVFHGSNESTARRARANRFRMLSPGSGGCTATGTESYTYPTSSNVIEWFDTGNGSPIPTIGTAATLYYGTHRQVRYGHAQVKLAVGDSTDAADTQRDNMGSESLRVFNASSNHIRLVSGAGDEWGIRMSSGNLDVTRYIGSGIVNFSNPVQVNRLGVGTTPIARPTVTGARGGNAALASLLTALDSYGLITNSTTSS